MASLDIILAPDNHLRRMLSHDSRLAALHGASFHRAVVRVSLEMILSARPAEEHDDFLRISALRHGVVTSGIAVTALAFWTHDAEASASSDASAASYRFSKNIRVLAVVESELKLRKVQGRYFLETWWKVPITPRFNSDQNESIF
jgi:hypothetical protein